VFFSIFGNNNKYIYTVFANFLKHWRFIIKKIILLTLVLLFTAAFAIAAFQVPIASDGLFEGCDFCTPNVGWNSGIALKYLPEPNVGWNSGRASVDSIGSGSFSITSFHPKDL